MEPGPSRKPLRGFLGGTCHPASLFVPPAEPDSLGRSRRDAQQQPQVAGEPGAKPRGAPESQEPWRETSSQVGCSIPRQDLTPVSLGTTGTASRCGSQRLQTQLQTQGQAERVSPTHRPPTAAAGVPQSQRKIPSQPPAPAVTAGETQPALAKGCGPREDFAVGGGERPPPLRGEPAALSAASANKIALCCALH